MSDKEWEQLNHNYHDGYQGTDVNCDDPNWLVRTELQAKAIRSLFDLDFLPSAPWLDYGAGDGVLSSKVLQLGCSMRNYDKYMQRADFIQDWELELSYGLVACTCVFEHVRTREDLDSIANLVADDGVLALHTMVVEEVPSDPSWNYYLPVHCSFFTNKSMQMLFDDWGFKSSYYHAPSRMWFCFKGDVPFKEGFVDYWK